MHAFSDLLLIIPSQCFLIYLFINEILVYVIHYSYHLIYKIIIWSSIDSHTVLMSWFIDDSVMLHNNDHISMMIILNKEGPFRSRMESLVTKKIKHHCYFFLDRRIAKLYKLSKCNYTTNTELSVTVTYLWGEIMYSSQHQSSLSLHFKKENKSNLYI